MSCIHNSMFWEGICTAKVIIFPPSVLIRDYSLTIEKDEDPKLTWNSCFIGQPIYFQDKIILEEEIAHYWEQVNQDQSQNCCQDDGPSIAGDTFNDIQQSLFSVY